MKLSKLPRLYEKAINCTTREEAQKIIRKSSKLTRKVIIESND